MVNEHAVEEDDHANQNLRRRSGHVSRSFSNGMIIPYAANGSASPREPYNYSRNHSNPRYLEGTRLEHEDLSTANGDNSSTVHEGDGEVSNETAAALFQSPIHNPRDALHLLLEASGRSDVLDRARTSNPVGVQDKRANYSPREEHGDAKLGNGQTHQESNLDPTIAEQKVIQRTSEDHFLYDALAAWYRLRFIRAGWFTAQEAISYVE